MATTETFENRNLMIHHHLGTGDHFICNGLVNYICYNREKDNRPFPLVYLACKKRNLETVSYLYSENTVVIPTEIGDNEISEVNRFVEKNNLKLIRVGFDQCDSNNFEVSFYKQLNIPYNVRYEYFRLPKTKFWKMLETPNEKYILIHDSCSDAKFDLEIETSLKKVYLDSNEPLFSHMDLINKASEIHCVNSSIYHLIDNMSNLSCPLFFHDVRRTSVPCKISKKWIIV